MLTSPVTAAQPIIGGAGPPPPPPPHGYARRARHLGQADPELAIMIGKNQTGGQSLRKVRVRDTATPEAQNATTN